MEEFRRYRSLIAGVDLDWLELRNDQDIVKKFSAAIWHKADAFIALPSFVSSRNIQKIGELARKYRLPGMFLAN